MSWGSLSEYAADLVVDDLRTHLWYVALSTGNPLAGGSIGELSGDGYARQAVTFAPASGGAAVNSSLVQFVANGGTWSNPGQGWYISVWDSSSGGNLIAVVVGSAGLPVTTMAEEVVAGGLDTIVDGATLRMSPGVLRVAVVSGCDVPALDPVAEVLAMGPALFWLFDRYEYESVQLLYQDDAATTPVTSNGDPVGCAKDLVLGREAVQSTSGRRPNYAAGVGIEFSGNGELIPGDLSGDIPMSSAAPGTQDTDLYGYGVGWVTDSGEGNQCILNVSNSATGVIVRNSLAAAVWGETLTDACTLADATYDDQRLDVYSNGCWARGLTYCAQSGNVVFRNVASGTTADSVVFGNYQPGNANYMLTGTISYVVFFDRLLTIPELAHLQQMLMRIGA